MKHECKESRTCCCSILADEPNEDCPVHGWGPYPPRCETCGKFMPVADCNRLVTFGMASAVAGGEGRGT